MSIAFCSLTLMVNFIFCGCYAVILIVINQWMKNGLSKMFEHAQLFGGTWPGAYSALCFSCGYFAYDQWDMLHYRLYSGWMPSILVHHLILLVCFTLALYRNVTINYLILTLICEVFSSFMFKHVFLQQPFSSIISGLMLWAVNKQTETVILTFHLLLSLYFCSFKMETLVS